LATIFEVVLVNITYVESEHYVPTSVLSVTDKVGKGVLASTGERIYIHVYIPSKL
jgi:hypothetical protein